MVSSGFSLVGVVVSPAGDIDIQQNSFLTRSFQLQNLGRGQRLSGSGSGDQGVVYFDLPPRNKGNQVKSYGGFLKFDLRFSGGGRPDQGPDVILKVLYSVTIEIQVRKGLSVLGSP